MVEPRFETYQRADGQWGWRLVGGNGEPMAASEAYTRAADAERAARDAVGAVLRIALPGPYEVHRAAD